ncbi:hypothetical protein C9374_000780 [Naegleria lovaniensis]|uniref:Uncharacterized protein n=1 Tax=Naegleria lovaniensis TaxID=51637 RepID=A0AA88GVX8_NAELO|nr:uncharacterized protein C9374_000780 [Naegleria lovaniensis]KAG2387930.1 hypothetical protein C9374_000780 [Naegleria lovaniensis]
MPPKQKASSLNPLPVNPLSSSKMLWASDQTKVQIPRWNVSGQTEIGKLGSPEMVYREFMNSERGPMKTIDLSNYYWAGEEAKVREEEQNRIKRLYDYGAKLLKLIKNSLPEIPNDKIENMEAQQQFVEEILKKNNLWDGQMTLLQKAFQSDIHIDKFIDFMIELWPEPTASKLIYLLHILTNNDCVKTNIRRRHIIRICNFIMHEESFENVCNFSLQNFCSVI